MPDANTLMEKVIPISDVQKYLDGTYTQVMMVIHLLAQLLGESNSLYT